MSKDYDNAMESCLSLEGLTALLINGASVQDAVDAIVNKAILKNNTAALDLLIRHLYRHHLYDLASLFLDRLPDKTIDETEFGLIVNESLAFINKHFDRTYKSICPLPQWILSNKQYKSYFVDHLKGKNLQFILSEIKWCFKLLEEPELIEKYPELCTLPFNNSLIRYVSASDLGKAFANHINNGHKLHPSIITELSKFENYSSHLVSDFFFELMTTLWEEVDATKLQKIFNLNKPLLAYTCPLDKITDSLLQQAPDPNLPDKILLKLFQYILNPVNYSYKQASKICKVLLHHDSLLTAYSNTDTIPTPDLWCNLLTEETVLANKLVAEQMFDLFIPSIIEYFSQRHYILSSTTKEIVSQLPLHYPSKTLDLFNAALAVQDKEIALQICNCLLISLWDEESLRSQVIQAFQLILKKCPEGHAVIHTRLQPLAYAAHHFAILQMIPTLNLVLKAVANDSFSGVDYLLSKIKCTQTEFNIIVSQCIVDGRKQALKALLNHVPEDKKEGFKNLINAFTTTTHAT